MCGFPGLTCFLQGLEAPGHPRDAGVEAAAAVVALLGGDLGVAAVHPVLGRHRTLVRRWPTQSRVRKPSLAWGWSTGHIYKRHPPPSSRFIGYNPTPLPTSAAPGPSFPINISGERFCERSGQLPRVSHLAAPSTCGAWVPASRQVPTGIQGPLNPETKFPFSVLPTELPP